MTVSLCGLIGKARYLGLGAVSIYFRLIFVLQAFLRFISPIWQYPLPELASDIPKEREKYG
jgi:hypothetical protein